MKTFMLGWEFPPFISGGLGTACYGLTKAMDKLGIEVIFVLPKVHSEHISGNVRILSSLQGSEDLSLSAFKKIKFRAVPAHLMPYIDAGTFRRQQLLQMKQSRTSKNPSHLQHGQLENYGMDIFSEVGNYAQKAVQISETEEFDIIHAHDWMTYPAGIAVSQASGKPLVVHVHSTEFDRSGDHVNQRVYDIERQGMHAAAKVITVSNYTKNLIVGHYAVPPEKVDVVYNAVEPDGDGQAPSVIEKSEKIVLFLGRITMQKGPEYFIAAAKKVLEVIQNVKFIMAGDGDMTHRMIELAARLGIGHKVLFAGFLRGEDVKKAYQMADLYVMPSVSEPFGITPLEAMKQNVPVLISKKAALRKRLHML